MKWVGRLLEEIDRQPFDPENHEACRNMTTSSDSTLLAPSATIVAGLAGTWAEKNPDLKARIERAVALVANVTPGRSPNVYFVEGVENSYMVRIDRKAATSSCNCADCSIRGMKCKHIIAVALWERGRVMQAVRAS